jgi:GDP/UDP-N,N'-diacetylbacillosamine 2-epimerase (hydrolysing)
VHGKVDIAVEDESPDHVNKSIARGVSGISGQLLALRPDIVLILGDRYEILAAAIAALTLRIPIAHIHGGEKTIGAMDDSIRHAITKMSSIHFTSHESYKNRIIQMGEAAEHVYMVGSLGAEIASTTNLLTREELEADLGLRFSKKNLLVTFHPETLSNESPLEQITNLFKSIEVLKDTTIVLTFPNADEGNAEIIKALNAFVVQGKRRYLYKSLGINRYLSVAKACDAVIGNSSSGVIEIPSIGVATINVGMRQEGRIMPNSVINCAINENEISKALGRLYSAEFQSSLDKITNPLARKDTAKTITIILESKNIEHIIFKDFVDH